MTFFWLQVKLVEPGQALNLLALKAAARGSHGARKHLLLASTLGHSVSDNGQTVYVTVAPEAGFGKQ
jgi:hypothetical protein